MYVVYVFKMLFVACATCSQGGKASCIGTLTIVHEDDELNEYKLKLKNQMRYKNLKRRFPVLRKNSVSYLYTQGDCCWKLYERSRFRGQTEVIFPGAERFKPTFQTFSIKKSECH